ncbi:putative F-box protein At2g02030 [Silene latifolia]|uniref:putative F-box protein At2g02030 n=1 Tax=Silene latifolia TaxID=37657 RepID=UPI003D789481
MGDNNPSSLSHTSPSIYLLNRPSRKEISFYRMSNANNKMMLLKRNNTEMADFWKLGPHTSPSSHPKKRRRLIRKQREDEGHTFCLPEEILFNILLRIPAKDLHEVVRYVSKQFFDIVTDPMFVRLHHQMSSAGFLIQNPNEDSKMSYIEADTTRLLKGTEIQIPFPARIMGSFNGLVLLHDLTNPDIFHVMNPATKVNISLPPLKGLCDINSHAGFGFTSSGLYKVVHVSAKASSKCVWMRVFTLGVDTAWRFIDLQGISIDVNKVKYALMHFPRFISGFIYWYNIANINGVALDVDTEIIYQFSPPEDLVRGDGNPIEFLSMGTCLGLLRQWQWGDVWRLWKLTSVKTGEWTEMAGINIRPLISMVNEMFYPSKLGGVWPVRLINGVFWFYRRVDDEYVVGRYDMVNKIFSFFPITQIHPHTLIYPHVHTLLSPGNRNRKPGILCSSIDDYNNY